MAPSGGEPSSKSLTAKIKNQRLTRGLMKKMLILFLIVPLFAGADTVSVENTINASASSGGKGQEALQAGQSKSSVHVETVVNGETVQLVDERAESIGGDVGASASGGNAGYEKETVYEDDGIQVKTHVQVQVNDDTAPEEEPVKTPKVLLILKSIITTVWNFLS
jgi:hypothetical protein